MIKFYIYGIALIIGGCINLVYIRYSLKQKYIRGGEIYLYRKIHEFDNPKEYNFLIDGGVISGYVMIIIGVILVIIFKS